MNSFHAMKDTLGMTNSMLAKHLSVSERTIRYWVSGEIVPKPSVMRDLEHLLAMRTRDEDP